MTASTNAPRRRLPTADEIKHAIPPETFYRQALPLATLQAGGKGWTKNIPCPFHPDNTGSFGVNLDTGAFHCFGCGQKGGSVIDFVMVREGLDFDQARTYLSGEWNIASDGSPRPRGRQLPGKSPEPPPVPVTRVPIPPEAEESRPRLHPKFGPPSGTWIYSDPAGGVLFYQLRFDPAGAKKQFSPLSWSPEGGWRWEAPQKPRPLYGLDRLAARPDAPVCCCEGEKAADAAGRLFPAMVAITSPNGASGAGACDFSPLSGRRVFIWPDADPPGQKYAHEVTAVTLAAGAASVSVLDLEALALGLPQPLPPGWDAADVEALALPGRVLSDHARWVPSGQKDEPPPALDVQGLPMGFFLGDKGIYHRRPTAPAESDKTGGAGPPSLWICPPVAVLAVTRNADGEEFGRLVEFRDLDDKLKRIVISDGERNGSADRLRERLASLGFEGCTSAEGRRLFLELLRRWVPARRVLTVAHTGWTPDGRAFVLPDGVIGEPTEQVVLVGGGARPPVKSLGTLDEWRDSIGAWCVGNSRLVFAVSMAFAPPLLDILGAESGGFHLVGSSTNASSTGKTTAQRAAVSVWGAPAYLQRWRTSDNALEGTAEMYNDCLLVLDELSQLDPKVAGEAIYMLASNNGKARSDRAADNRRIKNWRIMFLSSGEVGLAEHMASAKQVVKAGQAVRMVDIPADAGAGLGVFENLHQYPTGAAFADAIKDAGSRFFGTAAESYLDSLVKHRESIALNATEILKEFTSYLLGTVKNPSGQVARVAARFALVAVAGEIATNEGLTGWPSGEARDAAVRCFKDWLADRGGAGSAEEMALIKQVRSFFERHNNRFRWKDRLQDTHAPEVPDQVGYKDFSGDGTGATVYFALPEQTRQEILRGYQTEQACKLLIKNQWLQPDPAGKSSQKIRVPGYANPVRVYVFRPDLGIG